MLQESSIVDLLPQIVWTNDGHGKANYFNRHWYEYTGLTFEESEPLGWVNVAHEEDTATVEAWLRAFKEKRMFEGEARLKNKDGEFEWHLLRNIPYSNSSANSVSWFGTATNIHRLKAKEEDYLRTSINLHAILDAAVDFSIISFSNDGTITGWNSGAERMFGYKIHEIVGQPSEVLFTPEDRQAGVPAQEVETAKASGRAMDERWHLRQDGSRFFMSGVMTKMIDDHGLVKITRNITNQKLAEEALLLTEHQNNNAVLPGHMGAWQWDGRSGIISVDNNAKMILGIDELSFDIDFLTQLVNVNDLAANREEIEDSLATTGVFRCEMRMAGSRHSAEKWINCYGRVVLRTNQEVQQIVGVLYDVTERKLLQKHKDEFIGVASHELKTPVTSIKIYSELLQETLEEMGQNENAQLVQKLNTQVNRLIYLFGVLLDTNTLSHGKLVLNIDSFDLNTLIEEKVEELKHLSTQHKLNFKPSGKIEVSADRERIGQVITNFVTNAIKYATPGSINVFIDDDAEGVMVRVQDEGPGISQEDQARLFTQYFRGSNTQRNKHGSFGLGLYISSEIIKQHQGTIGVDSTPGGETTFYFKLFYKKLMTQQAGV